MYLWRFYISLILYNIIHSLIVVWNFSTTGAICYRRFEYFRKLIVVNFSVLLKLTVNTDVGRSLPPPKKFATELEIFAVKCIKEWNDEFGENFKHEFNFVFNYLNKYKKVRFGQNNN